MLLTFIFQNTALNFRNEIIIIVLHFHIFKIKILNSINQSLISHCFFEIKLDFKFKSFIYQYVYIK